MSRCLAQLTDHEGLTMRVSGKLPNERAEAISVSLNARLLALTEELARHNGQKRSQVIADALTLLLSLPSEMRDRVAQLHGVKDAQFAQRLHAGVARALESLRSDAGMSSGGAGAD